MTTANPIDAPRQWWEITITGAPLLEELITWRLRECGCLGTASQVVDQALQLQAYLNPQQFQVSDLQKIQSVLQADLQGMGLGNIVMNWQLVAEQNWAQSWQDYWHPQPIGERLLIHPAWLPLPTQTDRHILLLNPGVAFGTGVHATTQLCLRAIETKVMRDSKAPAWRLADVGCGTGILAIAALMLGVEQVYAVDTDPLAVDSARDSRDRNHIDAARLVVEQGSCDRILQLIPQPVDGFVCNILAEIILTLIPQFQTLLKPNGWGLLSGILTSQIPLVSERLTQSGWQITQTETQDDWSCLHISRR